MKQPATLIALSCVLTLSAVGQKANAQFQSLVSRIPSEVNVLMLLDVEKLKASPLAIKDGWAAKHEQMFAAGLLSVPPQATKFVSAAKFDLDTMRAVKHISVATLKFDPSMTDIAVRYRGTVDTFQGKEIAVLPGDVYVVKINEQNVAWGYPATRQDVARWMSRMYSNVPMTKTPYLAEAEKFAEAGAPMIFALDLTHAISESLVKERLPQLQAIQGKDIDIDAAAKALSSIRGVTLGVAVTDRRGGSIKVDFSEDISVIKDIAKPLLLEVLARQGATIGEFYDWDVAVSEKEIRMRGELTPVGSRRILSLLEPPPSLQSYTPDDPNDQQTQEQKVLYASQLYFKSVSSLLDDLHDQKADRQTMGQLSVWFDRFARKIDRMSVLNVDPDLVGYGQHISNTLRGGSSSVTQAAATSRIEQTQVPEQYDIHTYSTTIGVVGGGRWGGGGAYGWGGWSATPNNDRRGRLQSQIRTAQNIRGSLSANTVLQELDELTADVRKAMTQKYQVNF